MQRVQCDFCDWSGKVEELDEKACPSCDSMNDLKRVRESY